MQNFRKMGALLGAGAVIFSLAGCADRNGNGQPDSAATGGEVGNVVASGVNSAAEAGAAASNTASEAGAAVANGAAEAGAAASNVAAGASNAAAEAGAAVSNAAVNAGNAAANAGKSAADAVTGAGAAATLTPKIKTALGTQATGGLKGSKIDVDTNGTTKTVVLRGTVTSQAQKKLAETIAKKNAGDFKITNQLTVK